MEDSRKSEESIAALFRASLEFAALRGKARGRNRDKVKGALNQKAGELTKAALNFATYCPEELKERLMAPPEAVELVGEDEGPHDVSARPVSIPPLNENPLHSGEASENDSGDDSPDA